MAARRIGILCSGGDCPGLNAVLRAAVRVGIHELGVEVVGFRDGFSGMLSPMRSAVLTAADVAGLLPRGGTILGTSNRGNPFCWEFEPLIGKDRSDELVANAGALGLDGVVVVGGEGSLAIGLELAKRGLPIVGIPKTIDNDIDLTEATFGFDTAVTTAVDAIDRLHTTAESHHRVMVVEVMGRHAGWLALYAGLAGGGDIILIPEIPFSLQSVARKVLQRVEAGKLFSIAVVAEGAAPLGGDEVYQDPATHRLGGIGDRIAREIELATGRQTRTTVLGHIQRGGSPTAYDRILSTRFGAEGMRLAAAGRWGEMVALQANRMVSVPIAGAIARLKVVPVDGELVRTARGVGVCFGD